MKLRPLGQSGLEVSPIIFGAWAIGGWMWGGTDEKQAIAAIDASIDSGVTMIDTAAVYGMGKSEEIVGRALRGKRQRVLIATKCGRSWTSSHGSKPFQTFDTSGKPVTIRSDSRPESIIRECEESLRRLDTDVIDLYQIHWPDLTYPIESSMEAMESLRQAGKIRAIGVSNFDESQILQATKSAMVASVQPPYSLLQRQIETTLKPLCEARHLGIICYSPLERGLLSGAVSPSRTFPPEDHRSTHHLFSLENRRHVMQALERVKPITDRRHASFAQLAIRWVLEQPGITAAIVGARNAEQAVHNATAMQKEFSIAELEETARIFQECSREMGVS